MSHRYAASGKLTMLKQVLPVSRQTIRTLHWNAAARKEPTPHRQMTAPRALPILVNSSKGANVRRNKTIDILTRIVVSMKRRPETYVAYVLVSHVLFFDQHQKVGGRPFRNHFCAIDRVCPSVSPIHVPRPKEPLQSVRYSKSKRTDLAMSKLQWILNVPWRK